MTPFDYILLIITALHFLMTMAAYWSINPILRQNVTFKSPCHIWWVFPLIVIYRVWG